MVYVDDAKYKFGRMIMCHMIADTSSELLEMADNIGVNRKWIQKQGTHQEHFDICLKKKSIAISFGAKEISRKELGIILNKKDMATQLQLAEAQFIGFCQGQSDARIVDMVSSMGLKESEWNKIKAEKPYFLREKDIISIDEYFLKRKSKINF